MNTNSQCSDRGASYLEFTIILPLMIFILYLISDLALCLQSYLLLNHAVREGVKMAAVNSALEDTGASYDPSVPATYSKGTDYATDSSAVRRGHALVQSRIFRLILADNIKFTSGLEVRTSCFDRKVTVEALGTFNSFFKFSLAQFIMNNIPMRISAQGPYLFPNCKV